MVILNTGSSPASRAFCGLLQSPVAHGVVHFGARLPVLLELPRMLLLPSPRVLLYLLLGPLHSSHRQCFMYAVVAPSAHNNTLSDFI